MPAAHVVVVVRLPFNFPFHSSLMPLLRRKAYLNFTGLFSVVFLLIFASCEKDVNINLESVPPQIVVQGVIENGQPPYVILNTTFGFFSQVDLSTVANSFVHGAVVKVSDGIKTITLKEYSIDTSGGNRFYVYFIDTTNLGNVLVGELGKTYTLTIDKDGQRYSSITKIPYPKGPDTVWFGEPVFKRPTTPATALEMFANYTDPDTPGNYVKYFTKRNNEQFNPGGIFTDELVNGQPVKNIDLFAGTPDDNSGSSNSDSVYYFFPGDSVTLKWCEVDKGIYDFWNTYEFAIRSGGNPFSSPINVKTNMTNGALGSWAGYGALYYDRVAHP